MAKTPEGKVKAAIKARLIEHGLLPLAAAPTVSGPIKGFFFMPVAGMYSVRGIHDFVGCWRGRFFTLETKAEDAPSDATPAQEDFKTITNASGGVSMVGVRSASAVDELALLMEIT